MMNFAEWWIQVTVEHDSSDEPAQELLATMESATRVYN